MEAYAWPESKGGHDAPEAARLTSPVASHMLNPMRCLTFGVVAVVLSAAPALAQGIPGRDLLDFPIGVLAEPAALALETGDGFRNPASVLLPVGQRLRAGVFSLLSGSDQATAAQSLSVSWRAPRDFTVGASATRAAVDDIVRTDTDPQSIGNDVPYNTFVFSVVAARRMHPHVVPGLALRYRTGVVDTRRRSGLGIDAGLVADGLLGRDVRVGLSTFLWRPGEEALDETGISGAVDGRIFGPDSLSEGRVGYAYQYSTDFAREHYAYGSVRLGGFVARGGVARSTRFEDTHTRLRLALGLHHARYIVGVAREDSPAGLPATYQFMLSGFFR